MPACHAGGHEFESRTHRREVHRFSVGFIYLCLENASLIQKIMEKLA